jgi:hypothetical protein
MFCHNSTLVWHSIKTLRSLLRYIVSLPDFDASDKTYIHSTIYPAIINVQACCGGGGVGSFHSGLRQ